MVLSRLGFYHIYKLWVFFVFEIRHITEINKSECQITNKLLLTTEEAFVRRIIRALDSSPLRFGAATSNLCSRRSFAKARELKATKLRVQETGPLFACSVAIPGRLELKQRKGKQKPFLLFTKQNFNFQPITSIHNVMQPQCVLVAQNDFITKMFIWINKLVRGFRTNAFLNCKILEYCKSLLINSSSVKCLDYIGNRNNDETAQKC